MSEKELDIRFQEAVKLASNIAQSSLPQDVQLRLYAYYKQATAGQIGYNFSPDFDLRSAFKTNAWMQISHLSVEEAKELYIKGINEIVEERKKL